MLAPSLDDEPFGGEPEEHEPIRGPKPGGIAYITVTDAAGRVLFRRPATEYEIEDALRSAHTAYREGAAAMDRIAHDRLMGEIGATAFEFPDDSDTTDLLAQEEPKGDST